MDGAFLQRQLAPIEIIAKLAVIFTLCQPIQGPPKPDVVLTQSYVVTAYTSGYESTGKRPGHPLYGITASGERVKAGRTVSCPKELALGTVIHIEGIGDRTCEDRGGRIRGKRLDIYIPTVKQALEFGRQTLDVEILEAEERFIGD